LCPCPSARRWPLPNGPRNDRQVDQGGHSPRGPCRARCCGRSYRRCGDLAGWAAAHLDERPPRARLSSNPPTIGPRMPARRKYLVPKGLKPVRRTLATGETRLYWYHRATGQRLQHDPETAEGLLEVRRLDGLARTRPLPCALTGGPVGRLSRVGGVARAEAAHPFRLSGRARLDRRPGARRCWPSTSTRQTSSSSATRLRGRPIAASPTTSCRCCACCSSGGGCATG
jgi:hypothetical protein